MGLRNSRKELSHAIRKFKNALELLSTRLKIHAGMKNAGSAETIQDVESGK